MQMASLPGCDGGWLIPVDRCRVVKYGHAVTSTLSPYRLTTTTPRIFASGLSRKPASLRSGGRVHGRRVCYPGLLWYTLLGIYTSRLYCTIPPAWLLFTVRLTFALRKLSNQFTLTEEQNICGTRGRHLFCFDKL